MQDIPRGIYVRVFCHPAPAQSYLLRCLCSADTTPQPEHLCDVNLGSITASSRPAHSALYASCDRMESPSLFRYASVQAALLRHSSARLLKGPCGGARHVPDWQVFNRYQAEAAYQLGCDAMTLVAIANALSCWWFASTALAFTSDARPSCISTVCAACEQAAYLPCACAQHALRWTTRACRTLPCLSRQRHRSG